MFVCKGADVIMGAACPWGHEGTENDGLDYLHTEQIKAYISSCWPARVEDVPSVRAVVGE
eukprot:SAG31_NODE_33167_length_347_cov_0.625000_1_plen_59_part_10